MGFRRLIRKPLQLIPDSLYLRIQYFYHFHKRLNLKDPQTFNEKLQWLKLYYRREEMPVMVDKYKVKEYISEKIGSEYVIPLYGVWKNAKEIDIKDLPDSFVLKCNHDCGGQGIIICKDKSKLDLVSTVSILDRSMHTNSYWNSREWPYKRLERMIIAEQYLENTKYQELRDYKFFCFNGKTKCFRVDFGRSQEHHANYFSPKGELLPFGLAAYPPIPDQEIEIPQCLDKMIKIAEKLSDGFPFIRVDLYCVEEKIYFGELTFYPGAGYSHFTSDEWDKQFGEWLVLPKEVKHG